MKSVTQTISMQQIVKFNGKTKMRDIFYEIERTSELADLSQYLNFYFILSKYGNYQLHIAVNDSKINGINGHILNQPLSNIIITSQFGKIEETLYLLNDIELMVEVELECQKEIEREVAKQLREEKVKQNEENKRKIKEERIRVKIEKEKNKEAKRRVNVQQTITKRDRIS